MKTLQSARGLWRVVVPGFRAWRVPFEILLSQNVIPSRQSLGGFLPYAFTEQGVAMLSSVLKSKRAVQVSIAIMRTFVPLREILATHKDLARKLESMIDDLTLLVMRLP